MGNKLDLLRSLQLLELIPQVKLALEGLGPLKGMVFGRNEYVFGSKTEFCLHKKFGVTFESKEDIALEPEAPKFLRPMIEAGNVLALLEMMIFGGAGAEINAGGDVGQGFALATGGILVPVYVGMVVSLPFTPASRRQSSRRRPFAVERAGSGRPRRSKFSKASATARDPREDTDSPHRVAVCFSFLWVPLLLRAWA